ncbi:MAG: bifunctional 2-polyprenyl-6-hydroxyphenol methylase/3-demethylubiquinol 3-O-methyltransferase UbiG [Gammaproteobacteria bacterium]
MQNTDSQELQHFSHFANDWWNPTGPFKTLHDINPLRLSFIMDHCQIGGKQVLDIGTGGGILAESLAKMGAHVTAIDASESAILAAQHHANTQQLSIDYHVSTAEAFAEQHPEQFDVITCLELLEHVPDPTSVIQACSALVKPGGHVFFSTLNRNIKSYLMAIVGAEYLLKLLPKGTHHYEKFIRPAELAAWLRLHQLQLQQLRGLQYQPFSKSYRLSHQVDVNYLVYARKV